MTRFDLGSTHKVREWINTMMDEKGIPRKIGESFSMSKY